MKRRRIRLVYKKYHPEVREIVEGVISNWSERAIREKFDSNRGILARIHGAVRGRHQKMIEAYFYACSREDDERFEFPPDGDFITNEHGNIQYKLHKPELIQSSIPITPECC